MEKLDSYHLPVTGRNILRFAFPTIVMTVFNTFYTMVDGLFVSNLIGMEALSAINLTAPAIALITAVSGMLATGGSAVVMKQMGEHKEREARQDFTLLILTNAVVGAVMMALGYTLMDALLGAMGLSPAVSGYCHTYLSNYLLFTIPILLMYNFSLYLIAADKSTLSLVCTVAGGRDQYHPGLCSDCAVRHGHPRGGHRHRPGVLHHRRGGLSGVPEKGQPAPL